MAELPDTEPIHWMVDDGTIAADIDTLRPTRAIDETPGGRLAGIDADTWLIYREMHDLLTGGAPELDRQAYERLLADLAATLADLHKRAEAALSNYTPTVPVADVSARDDQPATPLQRLRYPPDGDVDRWIRDGPPGHVDYLGRDEPQEGVP